VPTEIVVVTISDGVAATDANGETLTEIVQAPERSAASAVPAGGDVLGDGSDSGVAQMDEGPLNDTAIALIVVAAILVAIIVIGAILCVLTRKRRARQELPSRDSSYEQNSIVMPVAMSSGDLTPTPIESPRSSSQYTRPPAPNVQYN
jgi:hypothetical protein